MKSRAETPFERALIDATLEEYSDVPDCEDKIAIQLSDHFIRKTEKLSGDLTRLSIWWMGLRAYSTLNSLFRTSNFKVSCRPAAA